jgi:SAM-dependent methyltransferase
MRTAIKQSLTKINLLGAAKKVCQNIMRAEQIRKVDDSIIGAYFSAYESRKLHIGCSENIIDGWLNSDLSPIYDDVLTLDATKNFPFKSNNIDYIFSEHMIENISYSSGLAMLREYHRVLRNNGKVRISTPDLPYVPA